MSYNDHIHVTGFPRSGTTLLMACLYPTVGSHYVHQRDYSFEYILGIKNPDWERSIAKRPNDILRYTQWVNHRKRNPNISLVLMVRDIRDIMTSVHHNVPGDYFIHWDYGYRITGFNKYQRSNNGLNMMLDSYDKFRKDPLTMSIRYEGLVKHPDVIQKAMQAKLGLAFVNKKFSDHPHEKIFNIYDFKRILDPIDNSSIGKWRRSEHWDYIKREFEKHSELFEVLIRDGYEKDKDWINDL